MRLMTIPDWSEKYFSERSRPSEQTVRRWLKSGALAGRKVGGAWYVDEHVWLADGDDLVLRVLQDR